MVRCVLSSNKRCDDTYISQIIIIFLFFMGIFDFLRLDFIYFNNFNSFHFLK